MWLRPVLYAFWCMKTDEDVEFIRKNMNVPESVSFRDLESYVAWLIRRDATYKIFNYLLLSWWLFARLGWGPTVLTDASDSGPENPSD